MVRLHVGVGVGGATVVVLSTILVLVVDLTCVTVSVAGCLVFVDRVVAVVLVDVFDEVFELVPDVPASQLSMQSSATLQSGPVTQAPHTVHYTRCQLLSEVGS